MHLCLKYEQGMEKKEVGVQENKRHLCLTSFFFLPAGGCVRRYVCSGRRSCNRGMILHSTDSFSFLTCRILHACYANVISPGHQLSNPVLILLTRNEVWKLDIRITSILVLLAADTDSASFYLSS